MLANRLRTRPTVSSGVITPGTRALGLLSDAPIVSTGSARVLQPASGTLGLVGKTPTLPLGNLTLVPSTRSLSIARLVPTVSAFVVSAHSVYASAYGSDPTGTVDSSANPPNPTVVGGSGSYSYLWTFVTDIGAAGKASISGSTTLNPVWSKLGISWEFPVINTWKLTVTDTVTLKTTFTTITVTLEWFWEI